MGAFQSNSPAIASAYGSTSSLCGLNLNPFSGSHGPSTRYPYNWPGLMPSTRPCQTNAVRSCNAIQSVCFPESSNRQTETSVAYSEYTAKFVPLELAFAPSGYGLPGSNLRCICSPLTLMVEIHRTPASLFELFKHFR